ncbi:MAG: HlyD family secretion protein, partial [Candidatus Micrarchaeota archaeon]|nr:HlyD family secretion protein [Candidatus Micrarchaeota archaeon]
EPIPIKRENPLTIIRQHPLFYEIFFLALFLVSVAGWMYLQDFQGKIYLENSEISAPIISLGSHAPGTIDKFYISEGDKVVHGQRLAVVGNETITAPVSGIILEIKDTPGQLVSPGQAVVTMVDPDDFRVVGKIAEDKGLDQIRPGQKVIFTVDAFGNRQYNGTVESVSPQPVQSDIVFSISDKRQEKQFEVKAIFDTSAYPEIKEGMSAKMWIYK